MATYVPKACAYVTRREGRQLLVFQGPEHDAPQIPKGTIESDEIPQAGVRREVREETGLDSYSDVSWLTSDVWERRRGHKYIRHFFHVAVETERDQWTHRVRCDGPEDGCEFDCRWIERPVDGELALDLDDYLTHLPSTVAQSKSS